MGAKQVDVHRGCRRHPATMACDFVHHDHGFGHTEACAPELFGHGQAEPAALRHGTMKFSWKFAVVITLEPIRIREAADHTRDALAYSLMVFVGAEIHIAQLARNMSSPSVANCSKC